MSMRLVTSVSPNPLDRVRSTLERLRARARRRTGPPKPRYVTWGMLKQMVDGTEGVTDDMRIGYVHLSAFDYPDRIEVNIDRQGKLCVVEGVGS